MTVERDQDKLSGVFNDVLEKAKSIHYPQNAHSWRPSVEEYEDPEEGGFLRRELR